MVNVQLLGCQRIAFLIIITTMYNFKIIHLFFKEEN